MTLDLTASLGCGGILSNYSRLYVDVNRPLSSSSLIRTMADGRQIRLNSRLTKQEVESRLLAAYIPYHVSLKHHL